MKNKKNFKQRLADHKPTKRRIIQLYAALLTNANLKGFGNGKIYQGAIKNICAPGLNCYSCPAASASCPLGALQNALASSNARLPYYVIGIFLLFGILFGRWICGFLCPFGLIQDLLHKVKTPKIKKNSITRTLSWFKYVILIVFVIALPLIYSAQSFPLPGFCKYICPSGTLLGAGGLLSNEANSNMFPMLGPLFTWKFCLLIAILLACIFIYRAFCRFLCPLGAIYGLFNRISILGIKLDKPKCTNCGICIGACDMDIRRVGDHECISCGKCMTVCPTNAISYKGTKVLLARNETIATDLRANSSIGENNTVVSVSAPLAKKAKVARFMIAGFMAILLAGTLIYYNFIDTPNNTDPNHQHDQTTENVGGEIGNICFDHELPLYGSDGTVSVEDYRGKITIVNFWYIFCGSCVKELQTEFPLIKEEYGDQVEILAVHSYEEYNSDIQAFIEESFPGADFTFCRDTEGEAYFHMLGGSQAWPVTIVLDENGVIVSSIMGSTTYDELQEIIESILNNE